jgi:hypothetical protein
MRERREGKLVLRGESASLGDQKAVGGDTERGVVVEAAPPAPFIIAEAEFLLELLIIVLDPPAQFGQVDQSIEGNILR